MLAPRRIGEVSNQRLETGKSPWGRAPDVSMSEVTRILSAIEQGEPHAAEQLLPLVYEELRKLAAQKLAQERPGQTLQATALVHEAYVRLVGAGDDPHWANRRHFFAAVAEAMRRILAGRAERPGHRHPQRYLLPRRAAVRAVDGDDAVRQTASCRIVCKVSCSSTSSWNTT
jgi:hypothetical protein